MRRLLACLAALSLGAPLVLSDELTVKDNIPISGQADPKFERFDVLLTTFFDKYSFPGGASLAVGREGKPLFARAYGYADKEAKLAAKPEALFRICSLSKPITAVAILQFVEQGRLSLDDKVMTVLNLQPPAKGFDERWKRVTIRHLLEHRGGWDAKKGEDPMFLSPVIVQEVGGAHPATPQTIIRYMLRKDIDHEPGKKFAYSNFGYCLLGRVVERLGKASYEAHVKRHVLAPLGIKDMRLARSMWSQRAPNEVRYYSGRKVPAVLGTVLGKQTPAPYGGFCVESMDSHGGWLATASDLLRFVNAFDDPKACKVLKPKTVERMFERPEGEDEKAESWYAKGWSVQPFGPERAFWHDGAMEGSAGMLMRRPDRVTFALLLNSNEPVGKSPPIEFLTRPMQLAVSYVFSMK
ncbi:MAG: serine hydrolase domain-containing protein [Gemmataceae bacterium]